jgi:hypothetical protein
MAASETTPMMRYSLSTMLMVATLLTLLIYFAWWEWHEYQYRSQLYLISTFVEETVTDVDVRLRTLDLLQARDALVRTPVLRAPDRASLLQKVESEIHMCEEWLAQEVNFKPPRNCYDRRNVDVP